MRVIGIFIVIAILFSYVPMISMDDCPEGNHTGNTKKDCGYPFHCPIVVDIGISETLSLPLTGQLVLIPSIMKIEELAYLLFRPPKKRL
jgi:hypothetical protein